QPRRAHVVPGSAGLTSDLGPRSFTQGRHVIHVVETLESVWSTTWMTWRPKRTTALGMHGWPSCARGGTPQETNVSVRPTPGRNANAECRLMNGEWAAQ